MIQTRMQTKQTVRVSRLPRSTVDSRRVYLYFYTSDMRLSALIGVLTEARYNSRENFCLLFGSYLVGMMSSECGMYVLLTALIIAISSRDRFRSTQDALASHAPCQTTGRGG